MDHQYKTMSYGKMPFKMFSQLRYTYQKKLVEITKSSDKVFKKTVISLKLNIKLLLE